MNPQELDQDVVNLAKALRKVESGENFTARGKSGEFGAYQYMPATWAAHAREAGVSTPLEQASRADQNKVFYTWAKKQKDAGRNVGEIASMHNAGEGRPNAYIEGNQGVNKYGVEYDTGAYARKVAEEYQAIKRSGPLPYQTTSTLPEQQQGVNVPAPDQGVISRLGEDLSGRARTAAEALTQASTGQINPLRGLLRVGGAAAGGVGDIVGAGLSAITPDFIEKPVTEAVGGIVRAGMETPPGQAAVRAYEGLDPEIRKDIEAGVNIASLVPTVKGVSLAGKAAKGAVPAATRAIATTGGLAGDAARKALVREALEIVSPKQTARVGKAAIKGGRVTPGGFFSTPDVAPDARTMRAAEAAAGIVRKNRTGIENANAVRAEITSMAQKLEKDISTLEVVPIVQRGELDNLMARALKEIGENPTMVGNAEKSAERILNKFREFLPPGDVTAFDLLKARKKLDKWIEGLEGGSKVFDPSYENAKTIALRSIRQGANDLVAEKAPSVAVKESLARQSALFDALENIAAKSVGDLKKTGAQRFTERHPMLTGLGKEVGRAGLIGTGLGGGLVLFGERGNQ
jgi:hypothetical protein